MFRKFNRIEKCIFSFGFLVGIILACILIISENEKAAKTSCEIQDNSQILYREWFSSKHMNKYPVDYEELSFGQNKKLDHITEAAFLYNTVRVLCVIFVKKAKNVLAVKNTWGRHCNEMIFFGTKNDSDLPILLLKPKSSWHYLCDSVRHIWNHHKTDFHWVLFSPDDMFAIPENLRYYVAPLDYNEPYYFGHDITFWGKVYNVGDAGYVLSKGSINALQLKFNSSESCFRSGKYWKNEDFYLGKHLAEMGITAEDTKDNNGCNRFNRYNLNYMWSSWRYKSQASIHSSSKQIDAGCYSDYAITFNGIEPDKIYLYDYLLYRVKRLNHGGSLGNHPPVVSEEEVWRKFLQEEGFGEMTDISPKQYYELWKKKIPSPEIVNSLLRTTI